MRALETVKALFSDFAAFLRMLWLDGDSTCAGCERIHRCGLPPNQEYRSPGTDGPPRPTEHARRVPH